MKRNLILIIFFSFPSILFAQDNENGVNSFRKLSWNINNITIGYEKAISQKSTIQLNGGLWYSFVFSHNSSNDALSPFMSLEYRNYYNILKRIDKKNSIINNSANFWVAEIFGKFPSVYSRDKKFDKEGGVSIRLGWGLQRPLGRRFTYQLQGGISLRTDFADSEIYPHFKTGFSYVF